MKTLKVSKITYSFHYLRDGDGKTNGKFYERSIVQIYDSWRLKADLGKFQYNSRVEN